MFYFFIPVINVSDLREYLSSYHCVEKFLGLVDQAGYFPPVCSQPLVTLLTVFLHVCKKVFWTNIIIRGEHTCN